jgi:hypothetical protein
MKFSDAIQQVKAETKQKQKTCYLYAHRNKPGYFLSFGYWTDWLFCAHPNGKCEYSKAGEVILESK